MQRIIINRLLDWCHLIQLLRRCFFRCWLFLLLCLFLRSLLRCCLLTASVADVGSGDADHGQQNSPDNHSDQQTVVVRHRVNTRFRFFVLVAGDGYTVHKNDAVVFVRPLTCDGVSIALCDFAVIEVFTCETRCELISKAHERQEERCDAE